MKKHKPKPKKQVLLTIITEEDLEDSRIESDVSKVLVTAENNYRYGGDIKQPLSFKKKNYDLSFGALRNKNQAIKKVAAPMPSPVPTPMSKRSTMSVEQIPDSELEELEIEMLEE